MELIHTFTEPINIEQINVNLLLGILQYKSNPTV